MNPKLQIKKSHFSADNPVFWEQWPTAKRGLSVERKGGEKK